MCRAWPRHCRFAPRHLERQSALLPASVAGAPIVNKGAGLQERDGGDGDARQGRSQANRRRPDFGRASSSALIGRGRRGGPPGLHNHDDVA
jgi:hypothetical protein